MKEKKISSEQYLNFFNTVKNKMNGSPYKFETEYLPPVEGVLPGRLKILPNNSRDIDNISKFIGGIELPVIIDRRIRCLFLDIDLKTFFHYRSLVLNLSVDVEEEITTTVKKRKSASRVSLFSETGSSISYAESLTTPEQQSFRTFMCALKFGDLAVVATREYTRAIKVSGCVDRIIQFMYVLDEFKITYQYYEDTLKRVGHNYLSILLEGSRDYSQLISIEIHNAEDPLKLIQQPIDYRELSSEGKKRILVGYTPQELLAEVLKERGLFLSSDENQQKVCEALSQGELVLVNPNDSFVIESGSVKLKVVTL